MFVFVVWHKVEYALPKRNRIRCREPRKVQVAQTRRQQATLSQLGAKKWDCLDCDYTIYRVNAGHAPLDSLLASINYACAACGLSGPFYGDGQIAWQGMGGGAYVNNSSKIIRQTAEKFLAARLDLLAQIRILAGYQSQTEAYTVTSIPDEMKERWTALLTPEIDRWMEYLASIGGEAYNSAVLLLSGKEAKEAFLNDEENPLKPYMGDMPKKAETFRVYGRAMSPSEKASLSAIQAGAASVIVPTIFGNPDMVDPLA